MVSEGRLELPKARCLKPQGVPFPISPLARLLVREEGLEPPRATGLNRQGLPFPISPLAHVGTRERTRTSKGTALEAVRSAVPY